MSLLAFNNKLVCGNGGLVEFVGTPVMYTYFKLDITALRSGSIMQLSELEFYDANDTKLNVVYLTGTPGNESTHGDENPPNMFDGRTDTKWCVRKVSSFVVGKATGVVTATKYRIATANDTAENPGRNPKSWTISTATSSTDITDRDSALWNVIDTRTNDTTLTAVNQTFFDFAIPAQAQQTLMMSAGYQESVNSDDAVLNEQEETSLGSEGI